MNEYVMTINQKEYRAEVSEINAEYALIQVNGREFRVDLQQLGAAKHQASAFQARNNFTAKATPDRVGLNEHECALNSHQAASLVKRPKGELRLR